MLKCAAVMLFTPRVIASQSEPLLARMSRGPFIQFALIRSFCIAVIAFGPWAHAQGAAEPRIVLSRSAAQLLPARLSSVLVNGTFEAADGSSFKNGGFVWKQGLAGERIDFTLTFQSDAEATSISGSDTQARFDKGKAELAVHGDVPFGNVLVHFPGFELKRDSRSESVLEKDSDLPGCRLLVTETATGQRHRWYLDSESLLPRRLEFDIASQHIAGSSVEPPDVQIRIDYEGFQFIGGGAAAPKSLRLTMNNSPVGRFVLDGVFVNGGAQ